MKLKSVFIAICCMFLFSGCGNDDIKEDIFELILNTQIVKVGTNQPIDEIEILGGNGAYRIVYPKQLRIHNSDVPYSASLLKVIIEGDNKIIVERTATFEDVVTGYFLITDQKGKKRVFYVDTNLEGVGNWIDIEETEKHLLKEYNYWQY